MLRCGIRIVQSQLAGICEVLPASQVNASLSSACLKRSCHVIRGQGGPQLHTGSAHASQRLPGGVALPAGSPTAMARQVQQLWPGARQLLRNMRTSAHPGQRFEVSLGIEVTRLVHYGHQHRLHFSALDCLCRSRASVIPCEEHWTTLTWCSRG